MSGKNNLEVWLVDLGVLRPALEDLEQRAGLLANDERAGAAAAEGEGDRRAARIALRLLLAREGIGAVAVMPLVRNRFGRPRIAGPGPEFSVSHAGGHALIALCRSGPVGVDLEPLRTVRLREPRRSQILAAGAALVDSRQPACRGEAASAGCAVPGERYPAKTGSEELHMSGIRSIGGAPQDREVLRAWTRLEALAKACGCGIGRLLAGLGLAGSGGRSLSVEAAAANARRLAAAEGLAVCDLELPRGLLGAVAALSGTVSEGASVARLAIEDCMAFQRIGHGARPLTSVGWRGKREGEIGA